MHFKKAVVKRKIEEVGDEAIIDNRTRNDRKKEQKKMEVSVGAYIIYYDGRS